MKNAIAVAIFSALLSSDLLYCQAPPAGPREAGLRCGEGAYRESEEGGRPTVGRGSALLLRSAASRTALPIRRLNQPKSSTMST